MKKKLFLLLTPLLLLSSCNGASYDSEATYQTFSDAISSVQTHTYTTYSVVGTGHASIYDTDPNFSTVTNEALPDVNRTNSSLFLRLPLALLSNDENADIKFSRYEAVMIGAIDNYAILNVEKTSDNGIHVYCHKVSRRELRIYNVDMEWQNPISISARFTFDIYYNQYGLMTQESFKTIDSNTNEKSQTVDLVANYTYA